MDTNLNDDVRINTYQHGDRVFTHEAVIHPGLNEVTLQYPSGLIDTGEFRVCVILVVIILPVLDLGWNTFSAGVITGFDKAVAVQHYN